MPDPVTYKHYLFLSESFDVINDECMIGTVEWCDDCDYDYDYGYAYD